MQLLDENIQTFNRTLTDIGLPTKINLTIQTGPDVITTNGIETILEDRYRTVMTIWSSGQHLFGEATTYSKDFVLENVLDLLSKRLLQAIFENGIDKLLRMTSEKIFDRQLPYLKSKQLNTGSALDEIDYYTI